MNKCTLQNVYKEGETPLAETLTLLRALYKAEMAEWNTECVP